MTLLNLCGYETGSVTSLIDTSTLGGTGSFSVQSSVKRTGNYAFRANPSTTDSAYVVHSKIANTTATEAGINLASCWYRFYFRVATFPAATSEQFCQIHSVAGGRKLALRVTSAQKIQAYDSTNTQLGSDGATTINADTWYCIEVSCGTGASASYEIKIDQVSELSGTGNLSTSNNQQLILGKYVNINGQSVDFYFDDVAIDDTAYPGAGQCKAMLPNADGNYTTFTIGAGGANKWECLDDVLLDATDYLLSTLTIGEAYTAALQSCAQAGITSISINAVKAIAVVVSNTSTSRCKGRFRSATTDSDTGAANISSTTRGMMYFTATDPATTAAWTESGLNGCEIGAIEDETVDKTRLLAAYLMVDYVPLSTAGNRGYIF